MFSSIVVLFVLLASALCQNDQRSTNIHADPKTGSLAVQHREKIFENDNHRLDGTASVSKNDIHGKNDPWKIGGKLDYKYNPSKTDLSLQAINAGKHGTQLDLTARQNIFDNDRHRLDATASLSKNLKFDQDPLKVGGRLDYGYKPFGAGIGVEANHAGRFGTQAGVDLFKNIHTGKTSWDIGAQYRQNFGGPFGHSAPTFGVGLTGRW